MDDTDPALDVAQRVAREGAPRRALREIANAGPRVDSDRAVAELRDPLEQARSELGEGRGRGDDVRAERSREVLVHGVDGRAEKGLTDPRQLGHAEHGREVLVTKCRLLAAG